MQKLNSKSVWIFFFRFLWFGIFIALLFGMFTIPMFMAMVFDKKAPLAYLKPQVEALLPYWWVFALLFFAFWLIFCYVWARLSYHFYRYELTENAYKAERGVIWKRYVSIPYERIQNVDIHRGIVARILGLSSLLIQTAGFSAGAQGHGLSWAEGILPGLTKEEAEKIREELIKKVKGAKEQGL